jgi:hypothetical protein
MKISREQFFCDPHVEEFVDWLSAKAEHIGVNLNIKKSSYVTDAISKKCLGLEEVLSHYCWKSSWRHPITNQVVVSEDWKETKSSLNHLSKILKLAVDQKDNKKAMLICKEILKWGGDRNPKQGATPQLAKLQSKETLVSYLVNAKNIIDANSLDTKEISTTVIYSGSMWTKIYALLSTTGAPIYDTRVSAAAAALVSLFLKEKRLDLTKNHLVDFSVPHRQERRSHIMFVNSEKMFFTTLQNNSSRWTEDTIKLSWLMDAVLAKSEGLFSQEDSIISRKHAFEASLFMVGYDVRKVFI